MRQITYRFQILFIMAGAGMLLCLCAGCGKEGKPLPPLEKTTYLPAPFALSANVDDTGRAIVTWKYTDDPKIQSQVKGFHIFAAPVRPGDCKDCPLIFTKIASVSMPKMKFVMEIPKQMDYRIKVCAFGFGTGIISEESPSISLVQDRHP